MNRTTTASAARQSPVASTGRLADAVGNARGELLAEARATLRHIREDNEALANGGGLARLGALFRNIHTYKSLMAFADMDAPSRFAAEFEQYISSIWHGRLPFDKQAIELIGRGVQSLSLLDSASTLAPGEMGDARTLTEFRTALGHAKAAQEAERLIPAEPRIVPAQSGRPELATQERMTEVSCRALSEIESLSANLTRLLTRLHDVTAGRQDERLQALLQAMHRNLEQIRQTVHQQRYSTLSAFFLPMTATVQEMAARHGKQVTVRLQVENIEVPKSLMQALRPSIVHILRNCVAHGVETPAERTTAGKPETGLITITAEIVNHNLRLLISDDGRGFNSEAIRTAAVKMGVISPEKAALTDDEQANLLVFLPGLSTSTATDELSGYGMGLAAVAADVAALGGRVSIESQPGQGISLVLELPLP